LQCGTLGGTIPSQRRAIALRKEQSVDITAVSPARVLVNGVAAKPLYVSEGTRSIYKCGSNCLIKVDTSMAQSLSEYDNYTHTPRRWRKYLAPAYSAGPLPPEYHLPERHGRKRRTGWVIQQRIPIMRVFEWQENMLRADNLRRQSGLSVEKWDEEVCHRASVLRDFADDLVQTATDWEDNGDWQWSVVHGRVCVHDYASWFQRPRKEYVQTQEMWKNFTARWAPLEPYLDTPPRGGLWPLDAHQDTLA
jgi:hypothetical protein